MTITSKIGFGENVSGNLVVFKDGVRSSDLTFEQSGKIAAFFDSPARELIEKARFTGVLGVIVPAVHFRDYDYFRTQGDFVMMVIQRFGNGSLAAEVKEKILRLDGKKVNLVNEGHELKVD